MDHSRNDQPRASAWAYNEGAKRDAVRRALINCPNGTVNQLAVWIMQYYGVTRQTARNWLLRYRREIADG